MKSTGQHQTASDPLLSRFRRRDKKKKEQQRVDPALTLITVLLWAGHEQSEATFTNTSVIMWLKLESSDLVLHFHKVTGDHKRQIKDIKQQMLSYAD